LLQEGLDLRNKKFELFAELHQELVVPILFGLVPTTPTDAPAPTKAFPTLTDVASLLPLSLAETPAPTLSNPASALPPTKSTSTKFNPIMFDQPLDLQAHHPQLSPLPLKHR
jgi:hypothetical protein